MESKMILYNILPYADKKLDCYQNMLVTLLHHCGCNVSLLGAVLPWRFYRRQKTGEIANYYIANDKAVTSLFGYKVMRKKFDERGLTETLMTEIKKRPIIVNVDQYYVPHHYVHIYGKQHGQHSLILIGYSEDDNCYFCIGVLPEYKGSIPKNELESGIKNFPYEYNKLEYSYIENHNIPVMDNKRIFQNFVESTDSFLNPMDNNIFSNRAIINIFENICHESDETLFVIINSLLKGTWIWELDRVANWTISYLCSDYIKNILNDEKIDILISLIEKCNTVVVSAYRVIYKSTLNKSRNIFNKGFEKLREAVKLQDDIYRIIKEY